MKIKNPNKFSLLFLYPLIFGIFPVIHLYLVNYFQIEFFRVIRSILFSVVISGLIEIALFLITRRALITRLTSTAIISIIFNYGAIYSFLVDHPIFGIMLGRARFLIPITLIVFCSFIFLIIWKKSILKPVDWFFSAISLILMILMVFNMGSLLYTSKRANIGNSQDKNNVIVQNQVTKPDIYNIVLDGYTNSTALEEDFGFDNSSFENELKSLGFIVPKNSFSNYDETVSSLSSSLNMDWVSNLVQGHEIDPYRIKLVDKLVNNDVRGILTDQGYKIFTFENEFKWSLWTNVDFYETPRSRKLITSPLNSFELMFIKNTIGCLAINYDKLIFNRFLDNIGKANLDKYQEQSYIFNTLGNLPEYVTPKFVFAHITTTHVPYVFDENGSSMPMEFQGSNDNTDFNDPRIKDGYIISIKYTNRRILEIVSKIVADDPNAIIIIQGDHGYPGEHRHNIFLAIYDKKSSINQNDCITPINLYRYLFNNWFDSSLPIVDDEIFKTVISEQYQYQLIGTCSDLP